MGNNLESEAETRGKVLIDGKEVNASLIGCQFATNNIEYQRTHSIYIYLDLEYLIEYLKDFDEKKTLFNEDFTENALCNFVYNQLIEYGEEAVLAYLWLVPDTITMSPDKTPKGKFNFFFLRSARPKLVVEWIYIQTVKAYIDQGYLIIEGKCIKNEALLGDTLLRPTDTSDKHNADVLLRPADTSNPNNRDEGAL